MTPCDSLDVELQELTLTKQHFQTNFFSFEICSESDYYIFTLLFPSVCVCVCACVCVCVCVCVEVAVTLLGQSWQRLKKPYAESRRWGLDMKEEGGGSGAGGGGRY